MVNLRLEPLSANTIVAVNSLTLLPGQEQFATPTSYEIAEDSINPLTSWPRVVLDGENVVGFIRGNFDRTNNTAEFQCCLWKINVAAAAQGAGVGRFAVLALADEARSRGFDQLTVIWEQGEDGPEKFFTRLGFVISGETPYGEKIGTLSL